MSVHVYSPGHARGENNEETEEPVSENWPNKKRNCLFKLLEIFHK